MRINELAALRIIRELPQIFLSERAHGSGQPTQDWSLQDVMATNKDNINAMKKSQFPAKQNRGYIAARRNR